MSDCAVMRESMPLLLTESLDPASRERTHQHIESCVACGDEWQGYKETWEMLDAVPAVDVPPRVKERFLAQVMPAAQTPSNVVPFHRRSSFRWLSQAAAVVIIAGGAYVAGNRTAAPVRFAERPAEVTSVRQIQPVSLTQQPVYSIAESRVLQAKAISPNIEGRPDITNVQFIDADPTDGEIGVSFDITSHVTVTGSPTDKSMVRLLAYVLEDGVGGAAPSRSQAIDWVREAYSKTANTDPEITEALAKVLRSEQHEGVRIKAVDTLKTLPANAVGDGEATRGALIEALRSDPNPAVRIKAVEALANMASSGQQLDPAVVEMLRQKASQDDENLYVRVKAAEALSKIRP